MPNAGEPTASPRSIRSLNKPVVTSMAWSPGMLVKPRDIQVARAAWLSGSEVR